MAESDLRPQIWRSRSEMPKNVNLRTKKATPEKFKIQAVMSFFGNFRGLWHQLGLRRNTLNQTDVRILDKNNCFPTFHKYPRNNTYIFPHHRAWRQTPGLLCRNRWRVRFRNRERWPGFSFQDCTRAYVIVLSDVAGGCHFWIQRSHWECLLVLLFWVEPFSGCRVPVCPLYLLKFFDMVRPALSFKNRESENVRKENRVFFWFPAVSLKFFILGSRNFSVALSFSFEQGWEHMLIDVLEPFKNGL